MKAYEFKITLKGAKPPIWRKIIVPAGITFKRLHDTIQLAMGWYDCHLHEFEFKNLNLRITNDEEAYEDYRYFRSAEGKKRLAQMCISRFMPDLSTEVRKSSNTKIDKYIEQCKSFTYTYDFGDGWEHKVELLHVVEDYPVGYPQVLKAKGNCPPEDCGGIGGYEDFLLAWNDPKHPEHESMREWGESQGYGEYDIENVNALMKEYLKLKRATV